MATGVVTEAGKQIPQPNTPTATQHEDPLAGTNAPKQPQTTNAARVGEPLKVRPKQESKQNKPNPSIREYLSREEMQSFNEDIQRQIRKLELQLQNLASNRPVVKYKKPFSGIGYYGTLLLVVLKDIFDIGVQLVEFFGYATVVIGIIFAVIGALLAFGVFVSTNTLYLMEGVKSNNLQKKIKASTFIAEALPIVAILPLGSIALVLMAYTERKKSLVRRDQEQQALDAEWAQAQEALKNQIAELASL